MLIGIVGKPSCGKSTFFRAATLAEAEIANYPFTTIEANEGVGFVGVECPETFFKVKCNPKQGECINGRRFVPAKLLDVAGLVPGAHEGKGLGNKFLDDLRQADVLIHVVDASGSINEKGEPVEPGSYDPLNDVTFLEVEIDSWFLNILKKGWQKFVRQTEMESKELDRSIADHFSGLKITLGHVKSAMSELNLTNKKGTNWTDEDLRSFATLMRKKSKPIIIAANKMDRSTAEANYKRLVEKYPDYLVVPCSAESELALKEAAKHDLIEYVPGSSDFKILKPEKLSDKQKEALDLVRNDVLDKWKTTGVQKCIDTAVLDLLKYLVIFPGGTKKLADSEGRVLPDAFLLPPGSTALDFAARLHTDFAKYFVTAIDVKTRRNIGKEHKLKNCDVIEIISAK